MAQRIEEFQFLVHAGATVAVPDLFPFDFPVGVVSQVDVYFPYGMQSLVGFQMFYGDKQVIPETPGGYAVGNGRTQTYVMTDFPSGQSWIGSAYNGDILDHTLSVYFFVDEITAGGDQLPDVILLPFLGSSLT